MSNHISTRFLFSFFLAGVLLASCYKTIVPETPDPTPTVIPTVVMPTSIALESESPLQLGWGETIPVQFRISPESALDGLSLEDIAAMVSIEGRTGEVLSAYCLTEWKQEGELFSALLADKKNRGFYKDDAVLVFARTDDAGRKHQIRSRSFQVLSDSFRGPSTGLPVVFIDTPDAQPVTSKEVWMEGTAVRIFLADGTLDYDGTAQMKGRGNSTWTQVPKKPYALKLDAKAKILGMPKHKRWCLLANWMDRTLIRNAVAFEISRKTGLAWTPSGYFVELVLNGAHLGNYYLCEQPKVDKNRVNITELTSESVEGGYLMEVDAWFDEPFKFRSPLYDVPWQFKDPDEVTQEQYSYMYNYVSAFEASLMDDDRFAAREYRDYIDSDSWVDWWLVNELAQNGDVNQPKSIYISKDVGGKLVAGPVWDFDWGTFIPVEFNPSASEYNYSCRGPKFYLNRICREDSQFRSLAKQHWLRYREALSTIPDYIDKLAATLTESDAVNSRMWPIDRTTNQDVTLSFQAAVARLKRAYIEKYNWMDTTINTY